MEQAAMDRSAAGIKINGSHIKAKEGTVSLDGQGGTGFERYGVSVSDSVGYDSDSGKYFSVTSFIGTNGSVRIGGESLALTVGGLQLYSGQASALLSPILCVSDGIKFIKSGPGVLTFSGNAKDWAPPTDTRPSSTTGVFEDQNNNSIFEGVTKIQALYAFGARDPIPVYLRLQEYAHSSYGRPLRFDYALYDAPSGGNFVQAAFNSASGTPLWTGGPTATNRNKGTYNMTYTGGVTLEGDLYALNIC
jgi:hypothetical protein